MRSLAEAVQERPAPGLRLDHRVVRAAGPDNLAASLRQSATRSSLDAGLADCPLQLATVLSVLWARVHSFDAADPDWPDRDRLVVSEEATPLLHGLLRLTGDAGLDPTEPRQGLVGDQSSISRMGNDPMISPERASGGHAVGIATGMALAERVMAARFGKSLVDHRVWAVAGAADLTLGVADEAASVAGQMRLDRLVLLVDATAPDAEDARARYAGFGWAVKLAPADDAEAIQAALSFAMRSRKPTLVWCSPGRASTGAQSPPAPLDAWRRIGTRGSATRRSWLKRIARHPQRMEFERTIGGRLPEQWQALIDASKTDHQDTEETSPAVAGRNLIEKLATNIPELLALGSRRGSPATTARIKPGQYGSRVMSFAGRDHGMATLVTGLALHGGVLPVVTTPLLATAEQFSALRDAARRGCRSLHLAIEPAGGQPSAAMAAGLLPALVAIPFLHAFRPGCVTETIECLELSLRRADGPSLLVLSEARAASARADVAENCCVRGGYVRVEADGSRVVTLLANGPELAVAIAAQQILTSSGLAAAVVSLPSAALFALQDDVYRAAVLGRAPRFAVASDGRGCWERWLGEDGAMMGGAPSPEQVVQAVRRWLGI